MANNSNNGINIVARGYWFALTCLCSIWGGLLSFGLTLNLFSVSSRLSLTDGLLTLLLAVLGWALLLSSRLRIRLTAMRRWYWRGLALISAVACAAFLYQGLSSDLLIYRAVIALQLALGFWLLPSLNSGYRDQQDNIWLWAYLTLALLLAFIWLHVVNQPLQGSDGLYDSLPGLFLVMAFAGLSLIEIMRQLLLAYVTLLHSRRATDVAMNDRLMSLPLAALVVQSDGKIVNSNALAERWIAAQNSRLPGRSIDCWLSDADWGVLRQQLVQQQPSDRKPMRWHGSWLSDGVKLPVELLIKRYNGHWLMIVNDHTEYAQIEAERDRALRSRDSLAYIIDQHLQEPVQVVLTQLQQFDSNVELEPQTTTLLQQTQSSIRHWQRLLQETQAYALLDSHQPQCRRCDLSEITHQVALEYHERLQHLRANLDIQVAESATGDAGLLYELAKQLISNAIKFRSPTRRLKITVYTQSVGNGKVAWCFADNGRGMKNQQLKRMLRPFNRGDEADAEGIPGSGMGLALAEKIVDIHHGKLMIETAAEQGCVVKVLLQQANDGTKNDF